METTSVNKINILGVKISCLKKVEVKKEITNSLLNDKQLFLSTPNPEIVLTANDDEELHFILNNTDIAIPDGVGLKFAGWLLGRNLDRWPGSDVTTWLLTLAEKENYKVGIFQTIGGLSSKNDIEKSLKEKYPKLNFIIEEIDREWAMPFYQNTNTFKPDIVFVTLGCPYQEKFIYHNILKLNFVKIALGVGGSFDYITGKIHAAPKIFKSLGLEWLWRLINISNFSYAKKRIKRIINAVVFFPLKFLKWLFINPFIYRKNVACILYKREGNSYKILLLEKSSDVDHFQLPQGGVDGQSLEIAGIRELHEEVGTYEFLPKKTFSNIYKYAFIKKEDREFRNFRGQRQGLLIAEFNGKDSDIKINYWEFNSWKWVDSRDILKIIHPVRRVGMEKFINKFNALVLNNKI